MTRQQKIAKGIEVSPQKQSHKLTDDDKERMYRLRLKGETFAEIAKSLQIARRTVVYHLAGVTPDKAKIELYRKNRAEILVEDQMRYRSFITDEKLKSTSAAQLEVMRCMTYDKERLERGQSTENVFNLSAIILAAHGKPGKAGKAEIIDADEDVT